MPDIFGRNPEDYEIVRNREREGTYARVLETNARMRPAAQPLHDFDRLGIVGWRA